jgi:hypothetical protein
VVRGRGIIGRRLLRHQAQGIESPAPSTQHRAPPAGGRAVAGDDHGSTADMDGSNCPMRVEDSVRNSFHKHRAVWGRVRIGGDQFRQPEHLDIWTAGHLDTPTTGRPEETPRLWFECCLGAASQVSCRCLSRSGSGVRAARGEPSAIDRTGSITRVPTGQVARSSVRDHAGRRSRRRSCRSACSMPFDECCMLPAARCMLRAACCVLPAACCVPRTPCSTLHAA